MPPAHAIAQHLPYLRRYARLLTGHQNNGDAYVTAVIETLINQPGLLESLSQLRVVLFQVLSRIWNAVDDDRLTPVPADVAAERHLSHLSPLPRQAFLLTAVEGFSEHEAARILDVDINKLRQLLEDSGRELAAEIATDVLIIEDEIVIAVDLERLVQNLGHNVIGIAHTHAEAISLARNQPPGLILADIRLADGSSGLDAVNDLLDSTEVPVIFITAYPERYLTGERPEPAFLIAKPYQPAAVSAVISQSLFFERKAVPYSRRAGA